jgi:hypothetical protein
MISIERQVLIVFARSNFFSFPLLGLSVSLVFWTALCQEPICAVLFLKMTSILKGPLMEGKRERRDPVNREQ